MDCKGPNQSIEKDELSQLESPLIPDKDLTDEGLLFNGFGSEFLEEPGKLPSDFLSQLVKAGDEGLNQVQVNFRSLF